MPDQNEGESFKPLKFKAPQPTGQGSRGPSGINVLVSDEEAPKALSPEIRQYREAWATLTDSATAGVVTAMRIRWWAKTFWILTCLGAIVLALEGLFSARSGFLGIVLAMTALLVGIMQYHLLSGFASHLEITARRAMLPQQKP